MSNLETEWCVSYPPIGEQQIWVESRDGGEVIKTFCPQIDSLFRTEKFLDQFQFITFEAKCVRVVLSTCIERSYNHIQELQVLGTDPTTGNEMIVRFVVNSICERTGISMYASGVEFPLSGEVQSGILQDIRRLYDEWVIK